MKKVGIISFLVALMSGFIQGAAVGAQEARKYHTLEESSQTRVGDLVFLISNMEVGGRQRTIFDLRRRQNGVFERIDRVLVPFVGTNQMVKIKHGSSYYIVVPAYTLKKLLVFILKEDGTIQLTPEGDKYISITMDAPPTSVTAIKDAQNRLFICATTSASSLEIFSLSKGEWVLVDSLPLIQPAEEGDMEELGRGAAAAEIKQSKKIISSILHQGRMYLFIVDDMHPQVQVLTMDSGGKITKQDYPDLILPFTEGSNRHLKHYSIVPLNYNNQLYLFVAGAKDDTTGFLKGWKLGDNGTLFPVIAKEFEDRFPVDIVVSDIEQGLYISVSFFRSFEFRSFEIAVYKFTGTEFEGPAPEKRVSSLPLRIRRMPYHSQGNLMVLSAGVTMQAQRSLKTYQIGDNGVSFMSENDLIGRFPMPYTNFILIPDLTKKKITKMLDEATKEKYPLDVVERISEFVVEDY